VSVPAPRRPAAAEASGAIAVEAPEAMAVEAPEAMAVEAGTARLAVHADPEGLRLEVAGELDLSTAGALRAELLTRVGELAAGDVVTLDLRPTGYLASAGLGLVLQMVSVADARGVELRVRTEPGTPPARILSLAGLGELGSRAGSPPAR
jgi:anti-anti-sigma factor